MFKLWRFLILYVDKQSYIYVMSKIWYNKKQIPNNRIDILTLHLLSTVVKTKKSLLAKLDKRGEEAFYSFKSISQNWGAECNTCFKADYS